MQRKRIMVRSLILMVAISTWDVCLAESTSVDLFTAFESAVNKTETIPIQVKITDQAKELADQAFGAVLPKVVGTFSDLQQQIPTGIQGSIAASAFPSNELTTQLNITQPVFQGLKEYANIRSANENVKYNELLTDQAKITLFQTVALAYFNVLAAEKDKEDLIESLNQNLARVAELREWYRIGRARIGDVQLEESTIATLRAQIEADNVAIAQARYQLATASGLDPQITLNKDPTKLPTKVRDLNAYLNDLERRPDIASLRSQIKIANEGIIVARSGHLPTVSVFGDLYPARSGELHDSFWDVGVTLSMPIYSGGIVVSQVRQAAENVSVAELTLSQNIRTVQNTVRALHAAVTMGITETNAYIEAAKTAKDNYKTQVHDFKFGLVTNLDVITAMTTYLSTVQTLDKTFYQTIYAYAQLRSSAGKLPKDLGDEF